MNHIKRMWGHYLAFLLIIILLVLTLAWFYQYFRNHFGPEIALVALGLILAGELILVVRGAVHAHRIHRVLREQVEASNNPALSDPTDKPMMFRVLDMDLRPRANTSPVVNIDPDPIQEEIHKLLDHPQKRRGKQARFPIPKIQRAVLQWEKRDPSFSTETLEEFLGREFGCGPDGILLMSVSTFYDWRRRILKELEDHRPPDTKEESSSERPLSEPSSQLPESIS